MFKVNNKDPSTAPMEVHILLRHSLLLSKTVVYRCSTKWVLVKTSATLLKSDSNTGILL